MRRFNQASELIDSDERNVIATATMDDDWLSSIGRLVQECLQIGASLRVGRFCRHGDLYVVTVQVIPAHRKKRCNLNDQLPTTPYKLLPHHPRPLRPLDTQRAGQRRVFARAVADQDHG